ncbi:MAG: hypothetical protein LJE69_06270 [Thiohalocapsa sp.]|jgi:hypothetical protein|nr:hypothetical protein [Thiohalocapsa sp.]MCG6940837.1 hypothetical protein [Thiohalocapsa sp.]
MPDLSQNGRSAGTTDYPPLADALEAIEKRQTWFDGALAAARRAQADKAR